MSKTTFFAYTAVAALLVILLQAAPIHGVPLTERLRTYCVTTLAGTGGKGLKDGPSDKALFNWPTGLAIDSDGTIFVADFSNNTVRVIKKDGTVTTIAGSGERGYADGRGRRALLHGPDNIALGPDGYIYVADADNRRIRKISKDGTVTTVAGDGVRGYRDGKALEARFAYPTGVAVDAKGNIYVADRGSHTVRKITPDGMVTTIAGNGVAGYADGIGKDSHLREPISLVAEGDGTVYVADSGNNAIRKITPDGVVSTIAGGLHEGYKDGKGLAALFFWPTGIALDSRGYIYVCDSMNNKIRRVTPSGIVTTIAGAVVQGFLNGPGYRARFNFPTGIAVAPDGTIYVADSGNNAIRKIYMDYLPDP